MPRDVEWRVARIESELDDPSDVLTNYPVQPHVLLQNLRRRRSRNRVAFSDLLAEQLLV